MTSRPHLRLVLASASPRRLALLAQVGIAPARVAAPDIDETPLKAELPRLYAVRIARAKAEAVAANAAGDELVVAADTVVALGRRILPKADSEGEVRRCLGLLSGRRHIVYTAVALLQAGHKPREFVSATRVSFKSLTRPEIDAYLESREGEGKAGGYAIQGRAEAFIRGINGSYSGVVGLPLREVMGQLAAAGFAVA